MNYNKTVTGYIFLASSLLIAVVYNFNKAAVHMASAWDAVGNFIGNAFFYGLSAIIGLVGLVLINSSNEKRKGLVSIFYVLALAGSFYYLHVKTTERNTPLYLFARNSMVSLKLRTDSSFRIINYGYHMAESWQEGTYSLQANKITLQCKGQVEAGLPNELWIRRDTVFYDETDNDPESVVSGHYLTIEK